MKIDDAVKVKNTEISKFLKLPPVKLHCSMLAEDAIKAAVKDYKKKQSVWIYRYIWKLKMNFWIRYRCKDYYMLNFALA